MYAYSLREKTPAHRRYEDNVPPETKNRRLTEMVSLLYELSLKKNESSENHKRHLVLVESKSKKSDKEWKGRSDTNKKIIFPDCYVPEYNQRNENIDSNKEPNIKPGDFIVVEIDRVSAVSLKGTPLSKSSLQQFANN